MQTKTCILLIILTFSSVIAVMVSITNDNFTNKKINAPKTTEITESVEERQLERAPWEDMGREWYYDNLNDEDRKKIRQAIDYCIPRQTIIDGIHQGYAVPITSPIGVNFEGVYEPTIQAREYDTWQASQLLEDVFGLIYDQSMDGTNATHTDVPYFKMTLVVPTTNTARSQWAALICYALNNVGIDATLKWWNWNIIMPRLFLDPVGTGYDYEHGGYDMFFVGYDASPDPTYKEYYDKDYFPPSANAYWIEDGAPTSGQWADKKYENITALWTDIYSEPDPIERSTLLKEYQQWCYDEVPTCIIRQEINVFGVDINAHGFDLYHGLKQNLGNLTIAGQTSAVIAQPGDYVNLNPLQTNSYYDFIILDNIFCSLARRRGDYNITHTVPWLAESWTHSVDYLEWVVTIRNGIKWSDGTTVTADDVYFTYQAALDEDTGYPGRGTLLNIIGDASNIEKTGNMEITFTLPKFYPYVETVLFQLDILQKAQMSAIPFAEWKTHYTNTKEAPIGCGQYMFDSWPNRDTIVIKANPEYDPVAMGHDPTMVGGGNWLPAAQLSPVTYKVQKEATSAVTGLKDGTYDFIDSQMGIQAQAEEIYASTWGKILLDYEWGYQEMGINHMNPIFGMNAKDPRDMYPTSPPSGMNPQDQQLMHPDTIPKQKTKSDWYYVNLSPDDRRKIRQAMDYCIPRQTIIDRLHQGYAVAINSPIGMNFEDVYDPTIQAREYSTSKASQLLEEVFGLKYEPYMDGTNATHTSEPYFKMTLVVPTTNTARSQWAALICYALNNVGIEATLKWWNWNIIMPRIFLDPVGTGYDYEHGGFDAFFVGLDFFPDHDLEDLYDSNSFAPDGSNYCWIENAEVDEILNRARTSVELADRIQALKDFQAWYYDEVPKSIIRQAMDVYAMDSTLTGFDPYLGYNIQNWTIGTQTSVVIAQPGDYFHRNPLISNWYADSIILDNIYCSLSRRRGEYNLTHAVPWLAESWILSPDYLEWHVNLKQGIKWSDGSEMTADDVIFTYKAAMHEDVAYPGANTLIEILGNASAVTKTGDYSVRFTLPQFHPYVETVLFGLDILQKDQMEDIPFWEWRFDDTNTKYSPIGCGAYMFDSYPDTNTIILQENPYYDESKMGHDPNMVGGGNWLPNPTLTTVTFKVQKEATTAVAGLKDGTYDFIDSQMGIQAQADDINASTWGKLVAYPEWGYQELGYNQYSPIWGMNPYDPGEISEESSATEEEPITSEETDTSEGVHTISAPGFEFPLILVIFICGITIRRRFFKK